MGMFDVPLSISYGEGWRAFYRLQTEIMQRSHDKRLFAWSGNPSTYSSMMAAGPQCFAPITWNPEKPLHCPAPYSLTNCGLRIALSIYHVQLIGRGKPDPADKAWIMHQLNVPYVGTINVTIPVQTQCKMLAIANLGSNSNHESLVILLNSPVIGPQQYRQYNRIATKDVIVVRIPCWDDPKEIFIE